MFIIIVFVKKTQGLTIRAWPMSCVYSTEKPVFIAEGALDACDCGP